MRQSACIPAGRTLERPGGQEPAGQLRSCFFPVAANGAGPSQPCSPLRAPALTASSRGRLHVQLCENPVPHAACGTMAYVCARPPLVPARACVHDAHPRAARHISGAMPASAVPRADNLQPSGCGQGGTPRPAPRAGASRAGTSRSCRDSHAHAQCGAATCGLARQMPARVLPATGQSPCCLWTRIIPRFFPHSPNPMLT